MDSQSESNSSKAIGNGSMVTHSESRPPQNISHALQLMSRGDYESLHPDIVLMLLMVAIVTQTIIVQCKKHFPRLYRQASWVTTALVPVAAISLSNSWLAFYSTWMVFVATLNYISYKLVRRPPSTQRYGVILCFYGLYEIPVTVAVIGLIATNLLFTIGLLVIEKPVQTWLYFGPLLLFYGFYYSLLSRGLAEIITDRISSTLKDREPTEGEVDNRTCRICNTPNPDKDAIDLDRFEEACTLSCQHTFHVICFSVWCIMGRKRMCPRCGAAVVPKTVLGDATVFYGKLFNFLELVVSWLPLICAATLYLSYYKKLDWIYSLGKKDESEL